MSDTCDHLRARGGWAEDAAATNCRFPIAPWNTASNVAYLIAGVVVLLLRRHDPSAWAMGFALVILGLGSAWYHGLKTLAGNRADLSGMYLVFGALAVHGFAPHHALTPYVMLLTGGLLALLLAYVIPNVTLEIQMGVLLWFSMIPAVLNGNAPLAGIGFGLFLVAYACWQLDQKRWLVGIYGHAIWHLGTAAAIALVYLAQP